MSAVVVTTSPADVRAVEAVKDHHARLAGALAIQVEALLEAAAWGGLPGVASDAMLAEDRDMMGLVEAIRQATSPVRAAANAQALRSLFESHLVKENEQILPLLAEPSEDSLVDVHRGLVPCGHVGAVHRLGTRCGPDPAFPAQGPPCSET